LVYPSVVAEFTHACRKDTFHRQGTSILCKPFMDGCSVAITA